MNNHHPLADNGSENADSDQPLLEGGTVENIDSPNPYLESDPKDSARRGKLALILVFLLCGLILTQYISIFLLDWGDHLDAMKRLESLFNTALPVVSGLAGAAVTYYFTRNEKR